MPKMNYTIANTFYYANRDINTTTIGYVQNTHQGRQFIADFRKWLKTRNFLLVPRGRGPRVKHAINEWDVQALRQTLPLSISEYFSLYIRFNRRVFPARPYHNYNEPNKNLAMYLLNTFCASTPKYKDFSF